MKQITEKTKNVDFQHGIAVSWASNVITTASASSCAGGIRSLFYGFDMARMLKGLSAELTRGNMRVWIPTYVRNDNSDASYLVDSANTVTNEKRLNAFLWSNREDLGKNNWLVSWYIRGGY